VTGEEIRPYLDSVFERLRAAIRAVAEGVQDGSRRLGEVEGRLRGVEIRIDGVGIRQGGLETRLDGIEAHQSTLEAELQALREEVRRELAGLRATLERR
jgi:hypothetical protein